MRSTGESFAQLARRLSRAHQAYIVDLYPPNEQRLAEFAAGAEESLRRQAEIEAADTLTFDQFLVQYFRA
jgi:glutamate--cysteine ligase